MSAFDRIIGYEAIKDEFLQICDMLQNKDAYDALGAKLPQGALLYGEPGLGKTMIANCFIEESGLEAFTIRKNKGNEGFINSITETFKEAKENAPCIVLLDDIDKFANEDSYHRDAEEYVAVQAGIDETRNCGVFVLATVNDIEKLPSSLMRTGRFDRKIEVQRPTNSDAEKIITYYLSDKKVSDSINMEDVSKMISYSSCAELETIINEAAINAAFNKKSSIEMEDIIHAVLRMQYDSPDSYEKISAEELRRIALHEAGHLVVSEALCQGSVGLASIRSNGRASKGGFIHNCKELNRKEDAALVALAGKAAVELCYSESSAKGCQYDLRNAARIIREEISSSATRGLSMVDVTPKPYDEASENMNSRIEAVVHSELEKSMLKSREILIKNKKFLDAATKALVEKETLLYSDIRTIREENGIIEVAV